MNILLHIVSSYVAIMLCAKFEIYISTIYEDNARCKNCKHGVAWVVRVTQDHWKYWSSTV